MIGYGNSMFLATHGILARTASGGGVDPDAQAFITAAGITNPTQQSAINTLVVNLKGYNIWTKFKAIYPIVGGSASSHAVNLKTPGTYNMTFATGWTHSSTGMTPNGATYADTGLNINTVMSLNSMAFGVYSRTDTTAGNKGHGAEQPFSIIMERTASNNAYSSINDNGFTGVSLANTDSRGFFQASRTASNELRIVRNTTHATSTAATNSKPNLNFYFGAVAVNLTGAVVRSNDRQIAFGYIADGFTQTECDNLYTAVQAFQTTLGRQVGTPIPLTGTLLNDYPDAAAAYSLRKLRSAYSGNCIRVRRSSDNTEQDFGFVNNVLDTASLLTFCGAGNGFVTTWYDQSGNAKNTTQSTAANQPRIVNAGSIDLVNSKPAILADGINDNLTNTTLSLTNPTSIFTVVDKVGSSGSFGLFSSGFGSAGAFILSGTGIYFYQNGPSFSPEYSNNNQSLLVAKTATTGTNWELYGNNTTVTNGGQNIGTDIGTIINLFTRSAGNSQANMYMQEFIVWNSEQMSNRTGIQTNINTFYSIY